MKRPALMAFFVLAPLLSVAQKQENNWFFGQQLAVSFESGIALLTTDNPQTFPLGTASISDAATGKLLFYSNGVTVWNAKHNIMVNGSGLAPNPAGDVTIFPVPGSTTKYFMFFMRDIRLQYVMIDMSLNNGDGQVITTPVTVSPKRISQYVVIRHKFDEGYWVVTADSRDGLIYKSGFESYYIDSDGVAPKSVSSDIQTTSPVEGDMVATHGGDYFVIATKNYTRPVGFGIPDSMIIKSYKFDRVCGIVSEHLTFYSSKNMNITSYGAAFSANDSILYVSCTPRDTTTQTSYLLQFPNYTTSQEYNEITRSDQQYLFLRTGPDKRIYMTTNGTSGAFIDVIMRPEETGSNCGYQERYIALGNVSPAITALDLPLYAAGLPPEQDRQGPPFNFVSGCAGTESMFSLNTSLSFDSVQWDFGDSTAISKELAPIHIYARRGEYLVTLVSYKCRTAFRYRKTVKVVSKPEVDLPDDLSYCKNKTVSLQGPVADTYLWSTGETTRSITSNIQGTIWLRAYNDSCMSEDSVRLAHYPDLATTLGNEYFICEERSELATLDAGEGFVNYKWTPTGDTTQWIIVAASGDYFVVVNDYRGCEGSDGTIVKKRCPVTVFFPNVFTPDKDGINDVYAPIGTNVYSFHITIFNRWGEKMFEASDLHKTWDGTMNGMHAPNDVYIYTAEYTGFVNKQIRKFNAKGNITLMR